MRSKCVQITKRQLQVDDLEDIDWCYTPIVQSGGQYDLRSSALSNSENLHPGVILCSLGIRYKYYCSNIARTFLIDPNKTQEKNYEFLLELQNRVLSIIRDGVKIKDVYNEALNYIRAKRPDLEKHFTKNIGFAMGIEFRESSYVLTPKNVRELKNGMVLNLSLGFTDLENPQPTDKRSKTYALLLIDSVRVTTDTPIVLTDCSKRLNKISFFFDPEKEEEEKAVKPTRSTRETTAKSAILRSKFRSEEQDEDSREQKRKEHQKQLHAQKQAEGLAKYSGAAGNGQDENKPVFKKFESYRSEAKLPHEVKNLQV